MADPSLAAIFERSKFGIAIAAMISMIATTINNSINENPAFLFRILAPSLRQEFTGLGRAVSSQNVFSAFPVAFSVVNPEQGQG